MNDLIVLSAFMLTDGDLLVETNYGPLFLDDEDFYRFKFDPYYVVDNLESDDVVKLMTEIKLYYTRAAIELIERGELNYENFS